MNDNNMDLNMTELTGVLKQKQLNIIKKEFFRKAIHLCGAFIPLFLPKYKYFILISLSLVLVFYIVCEYSRIKGKDVFIISQITQIAARQRDYNKFVLGPVTLAIGIILSILLFSSNAASVGILALSLGDGLASLFGKLFGKKCILHTHGKTFAGSAACFLAIFIAVSLKTQSFFIGFVLAILGTVIELIPLKDFDNILIPICISFFAQFVFNL